MSNLNEKNTLNIDEIECPSESIFTVSFSAFVN